MISLQPSQIRKLAGFFWFSTLLFAGPPASTAKPHPIRTVQDCQKCHSPGDAYGWQIGSNNECRRYCYGCHSIERQHHPTGHVVEVSLPKGIVLTAKRQITCRSCHNLQSPAEDSKAWRSESLFDSMFRKQLIYKTYYLIMRNNKGQLCRSCH